MISSDIEIGKQYLPIEQQKANLKGIDESDGPSFTNTLKEFISDVNALQKDSAKQTERLIKGEPVDIHDVMIATEKAKTSFELLLELRNKALDLYREVTRMQV